MRVAGVAVCAPECTAHIRVDRPEVHPGGCRAVEQAAGVGAEVPDVLLFPQDRGKPGWRVILGENGLLQWRLRVWFRQSDTIPNISRSSKARAQCASGTRHGVRGMCHDRRAHQTETDDDDPPTRTARCERMWGRRRPPPGSLRLR